MKKLTFILLSLFFAGTVIGQKGSFTLEGTVKGLSGVKIYLADFYGEKNTIIDSTKADSAGYFSFNLKPEDQTGLYRIMLPGKKSLDLIFNHEAISFTTENSSVYDSLKILKSEENRSYYRFMKAKRKFNRKFELLNPLIDYFPREDSFYLLARDKYISIQKELNKLADEIIEKDPGSFAARLIALQKPPFLDPSLNEEERFTYLKDHFFDDKKFNDIELLSTNAYPGLAIDYMSLFGNPNFSQDQLEEELKKAVDEIMYRSLDNDIVYEFIVDYLVGGFEKYHFDKVLDHIAQSYTGGQCENEEIKSDLATRLEKYAELAEGKTAPDIVTADISGNTVRLSEIGTDYVLVLYWASWCPHCNEALPQILDIYSAQKQKKFEILAISLDEDRAEWEKALEGKNFNWINACDLKGWNSKAARDYNVYATPTMFLVDKNLTIISKPITVHGLQVALTENGLL